MKRICLLLLALILTVSAFAFTASGETFKLGDVNMDGNVNGKDYAMIKRYVLRTLDLSENQLKIADVDGDGSVIAKDYVKVKRAALKTFTLDGTVEIESPEYLLYQDESGLYTTANLKMPKYNYSFKDFRVAVTNNEVQTTYFSEEIEPDMYSTTDAVLNEAVRERNDQIKEKYGVAIQAVAVRDVTAAVRDDVMTNAERFDAAMPFMPGAASMAQEGMLYDLNMFPEFLHFDAPWWDQSATESLSVSGHLYFTTGDISLMQKITSTMLTFNKTMYKKSVEPVFGDLYQLVRDHKWTLDLMYEMGKSVTADTDGKPGMSSNDTFGLSGSNGDSRGFYLATGQKLISKSGDDLPQLALCATDKSTAAAEKVLTVMEDSSWIMNCQDYVGQVPDIWVLSLEIFGKNRALFRTSLFSALKKLRNYDVEFGIVPLPLIDEMQEMYCTPCGCNIAYGVCIPVSARDPEYSAYMIEEMCCLAKNTITPAYYEATLKSQDLQEDAEAVEMLDQYVFSNVEYDPGIVYGFGGIQLLFTDLTASKSTEITAALDAIKTSVLVDIENCIDAYDFYD